MDGHTTINHGGMDTHLVHTQSACSPSQSHPLQPSWILVLSRTHCSWDRPGVEITPALYGPHARRIPHSCEVFLRIMLFCFAAPP